MKNTRRSAANPAGGKCRCGRKKNERWHLLCSRCWDLVPAALQRKLFAAYKREPGRGEHLACIREIFEVLGPRQNVRRPMPPGMTSTTTPAGIAIHDRDTDW